MCYPRSAAQTFNIERRGQSGQLSLLLVDLAVMAGDCFALLPPGRELFGPLAQQADIGWFVSAEPEDLGLIEFDWTP